MRPTLHENGQQVWRAFHQLGTGRIHITTGHFVSVPMGAPVMRMVATPQRLSWEQVQVWCDRAAVADPADREDLWTVISALDITYLDWWASQNRNA